MNRKRILEIITVLLIGAVLVGGGFWFGFISGKKVSKNITVSGATNMALNGSSSVADFNVFWQAWQDMNDLYLKNPDISNKNKMYGAINGLVQSLNDPYTEFFNPADSKQFQEDVTGDFGGIGAELGASTSSQIVVIAPLKGTPAEAAGLRSGDWIVKINGTSTESMNVDQAVNLIRGTEGTKVTLTIFRTGWSATKDFTITRANIKVPTVDFEMKGDVAHISLHSFNQDANVLFYQALLKAGNANAKGIVLDLRDDPGGYLEVAVDLSGYFLKPGTLVVKEVGRTVPEQDFKSTNNGALADVPMVVLINGGSASASEILAGALHDDRGIKLVGEKSFGKGTVQELEDLSDGSSLKITVAHWVMPSGRILDHDGIVPDYVVPLTDDDIKNNRDPQLDKAVQVLDAQIAGNAQ
jgi:carboxyl-terminal processing protease